MQLKTYTGSSSKEVLDKIKAELGLDAIILDTKTIKENGQSVVRMTAALERPAPSDKVSVAAGTGAGFGAKNYAIQRNTVSFDDSLSKLGPAKFGMTGANWQDEWQNIKRHIFTLMKPSIKPEKLTPQHAAYFNHIEREGASDSVLLKLYEELLGAPKASVMEPLNNLVPIRPWGTDHWKHRIHLIAGPYGSGKTSTAVRMAIALQKTTQGSRICLVNADAERGGGRMLLKHYAGLSDLSYREATTPIDMAGVISEIRNHSFDKVIVDLPALAATRTLAGNLASLGLNQSGYDAMAVHLVLPPHYDDCTLEGMLPRYSIDMEGSIVWSKLDEAVRYGSILNISARTSLPVSSMSFGPGLKDTLVAATPALLWRLIFRHELPGHLNASTGV